jgi:hypothetical protein
LNAETNPSKTHSQDPASEEWLEYYRVAKRRRRALGPEVRTRARLRRWRNRQRGMLVGGILVLGALMGVFYVLLQR